MYRAIVLLAALSLANAAALPAPDASQRWWASCAAAPNCEVYIDAAGYENIRFKRDMGPGSTWFKRNVQPFANDTVTTLDVRDEGLAKVKRGPGAKTDLTRAKKRIAYGSQNPVDLVASLRDHCIQNSCNVVDYTVATRHIQNGISASAKLKLHPSGIWIQGQRDHFMQAIQKLAIRHTKTTQNYVIPGSPTTLKADQFKGTRFYSVLRHSSGGIVGYLTTQVSYVAADDDVCAEVVSFMAALMGAAGAIGGIASDFFGAAGNILCDQLA